MKNAFMKILLGLTIISSLFLCGLLFLLSGKGKKSSGDKVISPLQEYQDKYNKTAKDQRTIYPRVFEDFSASVAEEELFRLARHTEISDRIEALKKTESFSEDSPLLIYNPYGVNSLSLYVYFLTENPVSVSYRISASATDNPIFSADCDAEDSFSRTHEYLLIGLSPESNNRISLTLTDAAGNVSVRTFYYTSGKLSGEWRTKLTESRGTGELPLSSGLYAVCGNSVDGKEAVLFFDNEGVLRSELRVEKPGCRDILLFENKMYFNPTPTDFAAVDCFGRLTEKYPLLSYTIESPFCFDQKKETLWFTASKNKETEGSKGVCDRVVTLSLKTGEVTEILDAGKLLPELKEQSERDEENWLNYIGLNSVALLPDDSVLLCARELSAILKVKELSKQPELAYVIGDALLLENTGCEEKLFLKNGSFPSFFGANDIAVTKENSMPKDVYYLTLFDNHIAGTKARPELDYTVLGEDLGTSMKKGTSSYYCKYVVNEKDQTFEQQECMPVAYTGYNGNTERTKSGTLLTVCAGRLSFSEYDSKNNLIATFTSVGGSTFLTVRKPELTGFWFAEHKKDADSETEEKKVMEETAQGKAAD